MAIVNYNLTCTGGHKATVQMSAKDVEGLCAVLKGSSSLIRGDAMLGRCAICGEKIQCDYSFDQKHVSDPDAVANAAKQGFEGR